MSERNPILRDPEIRARFAKLDPAAQAALVEFLGWLYGYARTNADTSWRRHKAPMAVYWSAVKAWAFHLRAAVNRTRRPAV